MFRAAKYSTMINYFKQQNQMLFLLFRNWLVRETSEKSVHQSENSGYENY